MPETTIPNHLTSLAQKAVVQAYEQGYRQGYRDGLKKQQTQSHQPGKYTIHQKAQHIAAARQYLLAVCSHAHCTPEQLLGKCRKQQLVSIRQAIMWQLHTQSLIQVVDIASAMGLHHTTVLYGSQVFAQRLEVADEISLQAKTYVQQAWPPFHRQLGRPS